jgi:hypothetical protein
MHDLLTRLHRLTNKNRLAQLTPERWQPIGARKRCLLNYHRNVAIMSIRTQITPTAITQAWIASRKLSLQRKYLLKPNYAFLPGTPAPSQATECHLSPSIPSAPE